MSDAAVSFIAPFAIIFSVMLLVAAIRKWVKFMRDPSVADHPYEGLRLTSGKLRDAERDRFVEKWKKAMSGESTALSTLGSIPLDHALAIVLNFGEKDHAMTMDERKTLNVARDVVDQTANILIGREPKKFGGRNG